MASEEVLPEDVIIKDKFVICLGGKYGVGKSTIFRILMSEYSGVMRDSLSRDSDTDYCEFDVKGTKIIINPDPLLMIRGFCHIPL